MNLEHPILAVDVVVFGIDDNQLWVLLHRREKEPFLNAPALPGVAVQADETLSTAVQRALIEKTRWFTIAKDEDIWIEQLAAFDALYRDPRGRTVSVAYMGISRLKPKKSEKLMWKKISDIAQGTLPFDHNLILDTAITRLKGKLRYTNIAKGFLPEMFRIDELQNVYEAILQCALNRTNFRNKLLKIKLIKQVSILSDAVGEKGGRPPHIYRFIHNLVESVDRDFL